jgi:gamma-glutamyltranspeptidase/glutathione hydrolase
MVVAPQPIAAEVGADLLSRKGNAFAAAIGAAFGQMVTDPQMCSICCRSRATILRALVEIS